MTIEREMDNLKDFYEISINEVPREWFKGFDCGHEGLNNLLCDGLMQQLSEMTTHTKVIVNGVNDEIVGYYSLKNSSLLYDLQADKINRGIPAVEIAAFAISRKYQNRGIGSLYLRSIIFNIMEYAGKFSGCRMVLLSSLSECENFYRKNEFDSLHDSFSLIYDDNRDSTIPLYLNLLKLG